MDADELYKSLDDETKQHLISLADEINEKDKAGGAKGRVILFLGSAVHYHAPAGFEECYSKNDRPPLASELGNHFIDDLFQGGDLFNKRNEMRNEKLPLNWITQYYEEVRDRRKLILNLSRFIDNKKPSPILKALAQMNFKYIVTTNYDHLFEDALAAVGKAKFHKSIYKPNRVVSECTNDVSEKEVSVQTPFLFKLHGDLRDAVNGDAEYNYKKDSIVITDEDYLHFILRMSQIIDNKEKGLNDIDSDKDFYPIPQSINKTFTGLNQNTFLFVGYGLRDYNLRLIFKTSLWKKDTNIFKTLHKWSIDVDPDKTITNIFTSDYKITFIKKDIWCAIPYLYKHIFNEKMPLT